MNPADWAGLAVALPIIPDYDDEDEYDDD